MSVLLPRSVPEALGLLAQRPDAIPIAGGTDLLVHWPGRVQEQERTYLDLSKLTALRALVWTDDALVIGALGTYWDVIQDQRAAQEFPLLPRAARQVGAIQIQARGTWAGNVVNASPAADGVPVLMAYGAVVVLESTRGRDEIPLDQFYTGYKQMRRQPDQLVTGIRVPRRHYDVAWFEKVGSRRAQAIAKVGLAVTRSHGEWRVVAASMAPTVRRCPIIERQLTDGTPLREPEDLFDAITRDVAPIDDIRSTAEYRKAVMARLLVHRLVEESR